MIRRNEVAAIRRNGRRCTAGIWTLQGAILAESAASLALVRSCGFREVGCRERIGRLHGVWRDTVLVERRSGVVGI